MDEWGWMGGGKMRAEGRGGGVDLLGALKKRLPTYFILDWKGADSLRYGSRNILML